MEAIPMMTYTQFLDVFGADLYAEWNESGYAQYASQDAMCQEIYAQYVQAYKEQANEA